MNQYIILLNHVKLTKLTVTNHLE